MKDEDICDVNDVIRLSFCIQVKVYNRIENRVDEFFIKGGKRRPGRNLNFEWENVRYYFSRSFNYISRCVRRECIFDLGECIFFFFLEK